MKKQVARTLTMISLVVAMGVMVGSAQAQSLANKMRINIPFEFSVGDSKLPAGDYSIGRAMSTSGDAVLLISNVNHSDSAFPLTNSAQSRDRKDVPTLVFHRYGDQYFLYQVWPAGGTYGRELVKSRSERELQRKAPYEIVQVGN